MLDERSTTSGWQTYEHWKSVTGASLKGSSNSSKAKRCFQVQGPAGEQASCVNYYCSTGSITPGPGNYKVTLPSGRGHSFGGAKRVLSESHRMYVPIDKDIPNPGAYDVTKNSREEYLRNTLATSKQRIKSIKLQIKTLLRTSGDKASADKARMLNEEIERLMKKCDVAQNMLNEIHETKSRNVPTFPSPIKPAFASSDGKPHQKAIKYQESPTFYRSPQDWDFGSATRERSIKMNAFGYSEKLRQSIQDERSTNTNIQLQLSRPKSRCRDTDFFGWNAGPRSVTPAVGEYTPQLVPMSVRGGASVNRAATARSRQHTPSHVPSEVPSSIRLPSRGRRTSNNSIMSGLTTDSMLSLQQTQQRGGLRTSQKKQKATTLTPLIKRMYTM